MAQRHPGGMVVLLTTFMVKTRLAATPVLVFVIGSDMETEVISCEGPTCGIGDGRALSELLLASPAGSTMTCTPGRTHAPRDSTRGPTLKETLLLVSPSPCAF